MVCELGVTCVRPTAGALDACTPLFHSLCVFNNFFFCRVLYHRKVERQGVCEHVRALSHKYPPPSPDDRMESSSTPLPLAGTTFSTAGPTGGNGSYITTFSRAHPGEDGSAPWWWAWSPAAAGTSTEPHKTPAVMSIVPAGRPHLLYLRHNQAARTIRTLSPSSRSRASVVRAVSAPLSAAVPSPSTASPVATAALVPRSDRFRCPSAASPQKQRMLPEPLDAVPPFRFAAVEVGVFRGAYPVLRNFPFLDDLHLKTIVSLTPEEPTYDLVSYCSARQIQLRHLQAERFKGEAQLLPTDLSEALRLLIDVESHPVYIHCLDGRHVVGLVVMALRKLQQWRVEASHLEYIRFTKDAADEVAFITDYSGPLTIPQSVPAWLWHGSWSTANGEPKPRLGAGIRLKFPSKASVSGNNLSITRHPPVRDPLPPPQASSFGAASGGQRRPTTGTIFHKGTTTPTATAASPLDASFTTALLLPSGFPGAVVAPSGVYIDPQRIPPAPLLSLSLSPLAGTPMPHRDHCHGTGSSAGVDDGVGAPEMPLMTSGAASVTSTVSAGPLVRRCDDGKPSPPPPKPTISMASPAPHCNPQAVESSFHSGGAPPALPHHPSFDRLPDNATTASVALSSRPPSDLHAMTPLRQLPSGPTPFSGDRIVAPLSPQPSISQSSLQQWQVRSYLSGLPVAPGIPFPSWSPSINLSELAMQMQAQKTQAAGNGTGGPAAAAPPKRRKRRSSL